MLPYEKWTVFKLLVRLCAIAAELRQYGHMLVRSDLAQFLESTASALSNLTEGAGRSNPNEKLYFYRVALGSINEANGQTFVLQGQMGPHRLLNEARWVCNRANAQMINLINSVERRAEQFNKPSRNPGPRPRKNQGD